VSNSVIGKPIIWKDTKYQQKVLSLKELIVFEHV